MLRTLKYFLSRVYTITSIVLFALSYGAIQAYAVYYPTDNITNPTCAPGDSGCYVSLLPDQTSKTGSLLFTDGTNPSWSSGLTWNSADGMLDVRTVSSDAVRIGQNSTLSANQINSSILFGSYINGSFNDYSEIRSYYTGDGSNRTGKLIFVTRNSGGGVSALNLGPDGQLYASTSSIPTTYPAKLFIAGLGDTSSTYTAQFHNSTGTNNALVIRDDGNVAIGTNNPLYKFHVVGSYFGVTNSTTPSFLVGTDSGSNAVAGDNVGQIEFAGRRGGSFGSALSRIRTVYRGDGTTRPSELVFAVGNAGGSMSDSLVIGGSLFLQIPASSRAFLVGGNQFTATSYTGAAQASINYNLVVGNNSDHSITASSRLHVIGSGSTSSTYTAQFHNSTGTNNALVVRDDGFVGIGTATPNDNLLVSGASSWIGSAVKNTDSTGRANMYAANDLGKGGFIQSYGSTYSGTLGGIPAANAISFMGGSNPSQVFFGVSSVSAPIYFGYATASIPAISIITNNNVGIGTTTPSYPLHINQASGSGINPGIKISQANTLAGMNIYELNGTGSVYFDNFGDNAGYSTYFRMRTSGTPINILTLGANGNVGIGTTSPMSALDVEGGTSIGVLYSGTTAAPTNGLIVQGNVGIGNSTPSYQLQVGSGSVVGIVSRFQNSTGTCDINPTTTSLSCSSDRTLKTNITNLNNTILNQITSLQPVTYTWINDNTNQQQTGFIAQDVEQIFPSLVSTDPTTNLKSLNYIGLIPYAIEGIRELDIKVGQLSSLDDTLKGTFASILKSYLANASNRITRIFTGEVCLTGTDGSSECLNKEELSQLKQLLNNQNNIQQPVPQNQNTEIIPETIPSTEPVVEEVVE